MANFYLYEDTQFFDQSGNPLSGGLISTFTAGTTTPQAAFTDSTGVTPLSNPVVCDSAGRAQIWLSAAAYKFVIKTSAGVTLQTIDGYNPTNVTTTVAGLTDTADLTMQQPVAATGGANQSSNNIKVQGQYWTGSTTATDQWVIQDVLGSGSNPTSTLTFSHSGSSGANAISFTPTVSFNNLTIANATITNNETVGGALTVTGNSTLPTITSGNVGGVIVVDGVKYPTIAAALAAVPAAGGDVYIPAGTYTVSSTLLIPSNCTVRGAGTQRTIINTSGATGFDVFKNSNFAAGTNTNITIRDLYVNCTSINTGTSRTVYFKNVTGFKLQNVEFFNSETFAVFVDDGCSKGWIQDNSFDTVQVGTCVLVGNGPLNATVTDITISNNYCANTVAANGIFVIGSKVAATPGSARITITGNRLFHCADTGIEVGDSCTDVAVTGNVVQTSASGETGILVRSCQNVTIAGNVVRADTVAANMIGIYIWNNAGDNVPFKNITICGNTVQGLSGAGSSGIAWSSTAGTSDGLSIFANTSINNTVNYDPRTTNITNLNRLNNDGNWIGTANDFTLDPGSAKFVHINRPLSVSQGGVGFNPTAGANVHCQNSGSSITFKAESLADSDEGIQILNTASNWVLKARGTTHDFDIRDITAGVDSLLIAQTTGNITQLGKHVSYGGVALVGQGLGPEVAQVDLTAQAAAITTTTLYAVPAAGAGQYRVSYGAKVTTAATTSSQLGALTVTWTDPDGVAISSTVPVINNGGTVASTDTANTTSAHVNGFPLMLNAKASTNIQYAMAYASVGATAMQYNLHIKLEFLG